MKPVLDAAIREHNPSHVFALFSGGHDSLTATAITAQHPRFTAAVHINTGIGIDATRVFVRDTCRREGWPLLEYFPDGRTYEELVLAKGFPGGPKAHNTMYYWLKQRQIRRLIREHKQHRGDRIMLVTGVRSNESTRRMSAAIAVPVRITGAQLWINPILDWTSITCGRFLEREGLDRNPVVDLLHRSGECLCGALAHKHEIEEIDRWFPVEAARIHQLERNVEAAGHLECVWAGRLPASVNRGQQRMFPILPLCASCQAS